MAYRIIVPRHGIQVSGFPLIGRTSFRRQRREVKIMIFYYFSPWRMFDCFFFQFRFGFGMGMVSPFGDSKYYVAGYWT